MDAETTQADFIDTSTSTHSSSLSHASGKTSEPTIIPTQYDTSTILSTLHNTTAQAVTSTSFGDSTTMMTARNTTLLTNSTFMPNITEEEKHQYLSYLQEQTTMAMIPAMTFLIILATVGLVGNSLVLFVYSRKFTQTSTRIFILAIATFDIVTNVVAIPGDIYDMFHIWDFDQPMICKARLYVNAFTTMVAAMVLVAIAVVRYRKICKPFQAQVSVKLAKILSVILAILSLLFSVPYAIINGRQTKETPRGDIKGYECTIDDSYIDSIWPIMNGAFFVFLFVACCIPLVVMYILIGVTAWKHSKVFGVAVYSKGKNQHLTSDSGNSNDVSTKSTDSAPLKFTKTPKTRSFVKTKADSSSGLPAPSSGKDGDSKQDCYNNHRPDNQGRGHYDKTGEEDNEDEHIVEYLDNTPLTAKSNTGASNKSTSNNNNNNAVRTVRSPTGETVHINLLMVKELTMKLKAVKKEAESLTAKNDYNCEDSWKADCEDKNFTASVKSNEDANDKKKGLDNEMIEKSETDHLGKENYKRFSKMKIHRNKSADNRLCDDIGRFSASHHRKRFSKSLDDLTRLTTRQSAGKTKNKSAENEDIDLRSDLHAHTQCLTDCQEANQNEETDNSNDEPLSEFAKAMQWVDLTYCLSDDQKENENTKAETNGEEPDANALSKKGSFALGRKISRDNSFLQRHRKLKDALTDTLTRARRNRKDRDAAEPEGKDSNGNGTLENINSESENVCNDDDVDGNHKDKERKNSESGTPLEVKAIKRKASRVKEDLTSDESCTTVRMERHQAKRRGIGRTTCMLILISAVYIFGFLPFLGLMCAKAASPRIFEFLDTPQLAMYNLFLRSYFLNSAANPIIYSLCDINFRRECLALLRRK